MYVKLITLIFLGIFIVGGFYFSYTGGLYSSNERLDTCEAQKLILLDGIDTQLEARGFDIELKELGGLDG